jgi:hypothetical protein
MKPGMLDRDLAIEIDYQLKKHGGDGFSFMPTVVIDGHGTRWARNWVDRDDQRLPLIFAGPLASEIGESRA